MQTTSVKQKYVIKPLLANTHSHVFPIETEENRIKDTKNSMVVDSLIPPSTHRGPLNEGEMVCPFLILARDFLSVFRSDFCCFELFQPTGPSCLEFVKKEIILLHLSLWVMYM